LEKRKALKEKTISLIMPAWDNGTPTAWSKLSLLEKEKHLEREN